MVNFSSSTAQDVANEIGRRVRALRLRRNITQKRLAEATLLSLNTIKALESGNAKISTLVAVLRELDALHAIDRFIPDPSFDASPHARARTMQRQRATGRRHKPRQRVRPAH